MEYRSLSRVAPRFAQIENLNFQADMNPTGRRSFFPVFSFGPGGPLVSRRASGSAKHAAHSRSRRAVPTTAIIDTDVNLFDWPFRKLKYCDTKVLAAKLKKNAPRAPVERLLFGSHLRCFPLETPILKLIESHLDWNNCMPSCTGTPANCCRAADSALRSDHSMADVANECFIAFKIHLLSISHRLLLFWENRNADKPRRHPDANLGGRQADRIISTSKSVIPIRPE